MLEEIKDGKISAVFVKDMSRLGRDSVGVGECLRYFLNNDIRVISVTEGVDSANGEDEMTPFRNIVNEMYARDISRKVRAVHKLKGESGIPLARPPYGYKKNPKDPRFWVIDDDAAVIVRRIFQMSLDGMGVNQIATALEDAGVLTPANYWKTKGVKQGGHYHVGAESR
jgi:site-specific DNA recombinase